MSIDWMKKENRKWLRKAQNWYQLQKKDHQDPLGILLDLTIQKVARGIKFEYMFRKLWKYFMEIVDEATLCPPPKWNRCHNLVEERDCEKCWRDFRKDLSE